MQTVLVRDESLTGAISAEFTLQVLTEELTVRELIRSRVYQEVQDYNVQRRLQPQSSFRGLIQPSAEETQLNGPRSTRQKEVDWKAQFQRAVEAYESGQMLILVDNRQTESLEETVTLRPDTVVSFLRLTMLVGG